MSFAWPPSAVDNIQLVLMAIPVGSAILKFFTTYSPTEHALGYGA